MTMGRLTRIRVGITLVMLWLGGVTAWGQRTVLGWDRLAGFAFTAPDYESGQDEAAIMAQSRAQIPEKIAAFNGQDVVLSGYMLPVQMEAGKVVEFLLVSDPLVCCYGAVPRVNEWVTVRLRKPVEPLMDVTLYFAGRLKVEPVLDNGYLTTIYELSDATQTKR